MIVATWNVENLFRPGVDAGPRNEDIYDAKLTALATVVADIGPDVLAVQEVGQPEALRDLADRLDGDWHLALSEFPDSRGIRVGVRSRLELDRVEHVRAFPDGLAPVQLDDGTTSAEMGRGALHVRVTTEGRPVDLVTCHLKSEVLTFPGGRFNPRDETERARFGAYALYRPAGEAVTVRDYADRLIDGAGEDRAVVVLGDLNDEPQAATTQILLGPPGSEIGTAGLDRPDQGDARRLWNLAPLIPEERRFTRVFRTWPELIDHILVSGALVKRVTGVDTPRSRHRRSPRIGRPARGCVDVSRSLARCLQAERAEATTPSAMRKMTTPRPGICPITPDAATAPMPVPGARRRTDPPANSH